MNQNKAEKGTPENPFTREELLLDLKELGVKQGDTIHLKVSMRSIGKINRGAATLIEALLDAVGETGTIIADSFITVYPLPLDKHHASIISDSNTPSYAGAFANAMLKHPQVERSKHPVQKFSAIGFKAKKLMLEHTEKSYAYEVLRIISNEGAKNLKIGPEHEVTGVGTTHVAIGDLGLKQKRNRWGINYKDEHNKIKLFEVDWSSGPCKKGFNNFIPYYEKVGAYLGVGKIGNAPATLTSMKKTLDIEKKLLAEDPSFMFCTDPGCITCRLTWEHSNGNPILVRSIEFIRNIREKSLKRFLKKLTNKFLHH